VVKLGVTVGLGFISPTTELLEFDIQISHFAQGGADPLECRLAARHFSREVSFKEAKGCSQPAAGHPHLVQLLYIFAEARPGFPFEEFQEFLA
jgi:hypothetical protein